MKFNRELIKRVVHIYISFIYKLYIFIYKLFIYNFFEKSPSDIYSIFKKIVLYCKQDLMKFVIVKSMKIWL